ncbi:MAG: hypothetical protein AB7S75_07040 [Desulfococcaceae bacterium]
MMKNILSEIICLKNQTIVNPKEFFIACSGVPTLVYSGFTSTLLALKKDVKERIPELKPENPGSVWPKTTLGSLRDDKKLFFDDAKILRDICNQFKPAENSPLKIDQLQIVIFQCRSLEKRLLTHSVSMMKSDSYTGDNIPEDHEKQVNETVYQFSENNLSAYWKYLSRDGNRESHYRKTHIEATLVYDIPNDHKIHDLLDEFIKKIDTELENYFCWFSRESRHMTIRSLV